MPVVELPEALLEVHAWTGCLNEFTHVSEAHARAADLTVSLAAVLVSQAMNVGMPPLVQDGNPALSLDRLFWVEQNYVRAQTLTAANAALVDYHADLELAAAWGGGELASADGLRFVVPVRTINAGPNPKYFARVNTAIIGDHWDDLLRVAGSLLTGAVKPAELLRYLVGGGHPTPAGRALIELGRLDRSAYLATYFDDELLRRRVGTQKNRQEARHTLARRIFHGQKGELRQRYREGQEDQLSALGLLVNVCVLWNTVYTARALEAIRAEGKRVLATDVARLSPLGFDHLRFLGRYNFSLPEAIRNGQLRPLRTPQPGP